jgi:hypothetical protein
MTNHDNREMFMRAHFARIGLLCAASIAVLGGCADRAFIDAFPNKGQPVVTGPLDPRMPIHESLGMLSPLDEIAIINPLQPSIQILLDGVQRNDLISYIGDDIEILVPTGLSSGPHTITIYDAMSAYLGYIRFTI